MQTAVTPSITVSTFASAGRSSIAPQDGAGATDFAALLFGQMSGETALALLPGAMTDTFAEEQLVTTADGADDGTGTDPTSILAAMGLIIEPLKPAAEDTATTTADDILAKSELPPALQTLGQRTAGKAVEAALPEALPAVDAAGKPAPANFAGFETKLAESLSGQAEPATAPAAPTHSSLALPAQAAARGSEPLQVAVAAPVKDPAWAGEFGQKVVWIATQDRQNAQLTLNPPQMGPIEISLSVKNDQATALFVSANPEVREAIESAMPRLREMLAGVGVELGQTNVSAESFRQARDESGGQSSAGGRNAGGDRSTGGEGSDIRAQRVLRSGNGLVDTFA